ncbi:hypothetical protein J4467_01945 [Candidatus Woesearchaeota archaeon]|nr:hypothetical protein [Candidatus Woesearchaeota archaeon]
MLFNPRGESVFVFESDKCFEKVVSIMRGMIDRNTIPAVKLVYNPQFDFYYPAIPEEYFNKRQDGGHHRLLAAYLLNCGLEVEIVNSSKTLIKDRLPLSEMILSPSPISLVNEFSVGHKFARLPSARDFFGKYARINEALRTGLKRDYSFTSASYKTFLDNFNLFGSD